MILALTQAAANELAFDLLKFAGLCVLVFFALSLFNHSED